MADELKSRKDVPENLKWNLSLIYKNQEEFDRDFEKVKELTDRIEKEYKGRLNSPENIIKCLDDYAEVVRLLTLLVHYTDLGLSVDYYDASLQEANGRTGRLYADSLSRLKFIDSQILEQEDAVIDKAIEMAIASKCYLKDIKREKAHMLHPEAERVLAAMSQTLECPYEIYNVTKLADMAFENFTVDGQENPLGYSLFEDNYEYDNRTPVRRAAFENFSKKIRQYANTTASAYNTQVFKEKALSDLRGFENVFESLLFGQKVTMEMYNRQIDLIMEKLAPHMRKYAGLLKKIHGLDKMTFADLKLTVDPEYDPKVTIEESKEYIIKGLSIMGEDYVDMIKEAYDKRWVDFAQNKGKSTGGFCASPYGKSSFILLSWNERMSDVFTLAHELGHAGHFKRCNEKQSIFDTNVSTYLVEAPSTMNELLLGHYLLGTSQDKRFRRWVLANMVSNTYYHNFVTHLLEAAYQREVYRLVEQGTNLTADTLSGIMKNVLGRFWGDEVELVEGAELTWMRQPHYYMGLYSYTYSAGLTLATQVVKRIEKEGQAAVEDWKNMLNAGSTLDPVGLAKVAGIDITTDQPLLDTIETIGRYIDEICQLTEEI